MIDLVFDNFADEQYQLVYRSWLISVVPEGFKNYYVKNFKNQGEREIGTESKVVIYLSWKIKKSVKLVGLGKYISLVSHIFRLPFMYVFGPRQPKVKNPYIFSRKVILVCWKKYMQLHKSVLRYTQDT